MTISNPLYTVIAVKNLTINNFLKVAHMEESLKNDTYTERRMKQRFICDNPAFVQDSLTQGKTISVNGRVTNMSSVGMFVVTSQEIPKDTEVIVKITFPTGSQSWGTTNLEAVGNVVRCETQSDGKVGLAIKFETYKFL